MRKSACVVFLAVSVAVPVLARQKPPRTYPERGKVVGIMAPVRTTSVGTVLSQGTRDVYGVSVAYGKSSPVVTNSLTPGSYRIETADEFYEFGNRDRHPSLSLNQVIQFRVKKGVAYVSEPHGKEKKYRIIGEESKPSNSNGQASLPTLPTTAAGPKPSVIRPQPAVSVVSGEWTATFEDSVSSGTLAVTLQSAAGGAVSGTYNASSGGFGTIAGDLTGSTLQFTLTQTVKACPGSYMGIVTFGADSGSGVYSGSDCLGKHDRGVISFARH